jgi:hypothetical protein
MQSTAALMAGLQSFDSSDAGADSRAGGITAGGITFGSVAPSFHSEDYDEEMGGQQQWKRDAGKRREEDDFESLLDEEEMPGGGEEGEAEQQHEQQHPTRRPPPAHLVASSSSRPPSALSAARTTSSRNPSASTAPTDAPSPKPRLPPSAVLDLGDHNSRGEDSGEVEREQSGMLRGLNMDESRDSGRWGKVNGASSGGKKKGGVGQNMTLREQEKVRAIRSRLC